MLVSRDRLEVAIDIERIKIVLLQILAVILSLLVSPPKEAANEEDERRNHRCDDIDGNTVSLRTATEGQLCAGSAHKLY